MLDGGDGSTSSGRAGTDMLTGGTGSDRFVFRPGDVGTIDTIADFSIAELDVVILSRLDADVTTDADEAFTFIGYAGFTGTAGGLQAVDLVGVQRIEGDMDGDGSGTPHVRHARDRCRTGQLVRALTEPGRRHGVRRPFTTDKGCQPGSAGRAPG